MENRLVFVGMLCRWVDKTINKYKGDLYNDGIVVCFTAAVAIHTHE